MKKDTCLRCEQKQESDSAGDVQRFCRPLYALCVDYKEASASGQTHKYRSTSVEGQLYVLFFPFYFRFRFVLPNIFSSVLIISILKLCFVYHLG